MMDGSFFAFAVLGLLGYIVGDFQRERRYRRQARANLTLSNQRAHDRANQRAAAVRSLPATDGDSNDDGAAFALANARHAQARRRAVRGDNVRSGSVSPTAGRYLRSANETPVMAGGVDFDGD